MQQSGSQYHLEVFNFANTVLNDCDPCPRFSAYYQYFKGIVSGRIKTSLYKLSPPKEAKAVKAPNYD